MLERVLTIKHLEKQSLTRVEGQELVIETWNPSDGLQEFRRS